VLYSSLTERETRALCDAYADASGVPIECMVDTADRLIDAMVAKAYRPGADVLVVAGAHALGRAVTEDVLRPVPLSQWQEVIPQGFRDADRYWVGLAADALAIVYRPDHVDARTLVSYAELGGDAYDGALCLRGADAESSRSLVAALIASLGLRDAEMVVRGWVRNLATPTWRDDAGILEALDAGRCGIAIVGSAALAAYTGAHSGSRLAVAWPRDPAVGLQLDPVGAGISRHANSPDAAAQLLEWLTGAGGQQVLAAATGLRPLRPGVAPASPLDRLGVPDPGPAVPADNVLYASEILPLLDRARFGDGVAPPE